jgi:succinate dehydrogenase hydrophobic anchor subunit
VSGLSDRFYCEWMKFTSESYELYFKHFLLIVGLFSHSIDHTVIISPSIGPSMAKFAFKILNTLILVFCAP